MSRKQLTAIARQANTYRMEAFTLIEGDEYPEPGRAMLHGDYDGFGKVADLAVAVLSNTGSVEAALTQLDSVPAIEAGEPPDWPAYGYAIAYDNALAWGRDRFNECLGAVS